MDLSLEIEEYKLNIRTGAVIIHNNKVLTHRDINKEYNTCGWIFMDYLSHQEPGNLAYVFFSFRGLWGDELGQGPDGRESVGQI